MGTINYQQRGWGPFVSYEIEVVYETLDDDGYSGVVDSKTFKKFDHAESWGYDRLLEFRLNG